MYTRLFFGKHGVDDRDELFVELACRLDLAARRQNSSHFVVQGSQRFIGQVYLIPGIAGAEIKITFRVLCEIPFRPTPLPVLQLINLMIVGRSTSGKLLFCLAQEFVFTQNIVPNNAGIQASVVNVDASVFDKEKSQIGPEIAVLADSSQRRTGFG